jgi:hypothetical protein
MKVRIFADNRNDRRVWQWEDGVYITDDSKEIEEFRCLGFRIEEVQEPKKVKNTVIKKKPPVVPAKKAKKKAS